MIEKDVSQISSTFRDNLNERIRNGNTEMTSDQLIGYIKNISNLANRLRDNRALLRDGFDRFEMYVHFQKIDKSVRRIKKITSEVCTEESFVCVFFF